jgi:succinyl-CoA synthetase alpha subunit
VSILVGKESRVVVQGVTGKEGSFHTRQMLEYGTKVVAGVTPGKAGQQVEGVPVYHTVAEAVAHQGANVSIIFVPPAFAADAIMEAAAAEIGVIACITEGLPTLDMVRVRHYLKDRAAVLIGPNCPGVITPGACKLGIMPGYIFQPGTIGVISRSGTLTYEVVDQISKQGLGQSTCLGIGGDPIIGLNFIDLLKLFAEDDQTGGVVLIGEIGGTAEEEAAAYIKDHFPKPVVTFIAGQTAPPGRRMGHAGAIISGKSGTAQEKMAVLQAAGIRVVVDLTKVGEAMKEVMGGIAPH